MRALLALLLCVLPCTLAAQAIEFTAIPALGDQDTRAAVALAPGAFEQIVAQIEPTAFDTPKSWEKELRLRRLAIGDADGLIVRGSNLLCGGTGNCQTWLFRRSVKGWTSLFAGEAPVLASVGFARHQSAGMPDLVATIHRSAAASLVVVDEFDGTAYRAARCYEVEGARQPRNIPCP